MNDLSKLYRQYLDVTENPQAAATLVLAHVAGREKTENLTVKQAARQLGVSAAKVYALCDSGQLVHSKIGRAVRIQPQDLRDYMDPAHREAEPDEFTCLSL